MSFSLTLFDSCLVPYVDSELGRIGCGVTSHITNRS